MIVRNYPITTDNVKNVGGKDMILSRMVNHYTALTKAKSVIDTRKPHPAIKKTNHEIKKDLYKKEEFHNVREAYKKISSTKHYIDNKEPDTFNMKRKNFNKPIKEKYDEIEHLRTLKAMTKRIFSLGKMHERKKNRYDPICNPTYFFRDANQKQNQHDEAMKLISLKNLNEKLKKMNEKEKNKLLLGNTIYEAVENIDVDNWNQICKKQMQQQRPKSVINKKNQIITNPIHLEYNPEKYIQIHKFNRENDGEKIMKKYKNQKKKGSAPKNIKNKIQYDKLPIYNDNDVNGIDNAESEFIDNVRQFIIENDIYTDQNFNELVQKLVEKNKDCKNISKYQIQKIVLDIKSFLEA